jgi:hypothetical protein
MDYYDLYNGVILLQYAIGKYQIPGNMCRQIFVHGLM